jgi:hypothetical protein
MLGGALLAAPTASADSPTLTIGSLNLRVGEEGTVEVRALDISQWRLGAWTFDVIHDPDIVSTVSCDGADVGVCGPSFSANSDRVSGASKDGLEGDATLAHFTFRCEHDGTSQLAFEVSVWADAILGRPDVDLNLDIRPGSVTCEDAEPTEGYATALPTRTIALPSTGSAADGTDTTWPVAALAAFGAIALVASAALARRRA